MNRPIVKAADHYCGAGGTFEGLERAAASLGVELDAVAINHDPVAIATHSGNHPRARHYCQDLADVDPREAVSGGYLDLLVSSPECTHFSQARGGKPISDQKRQGAWQVIRWCRELHARCVLVENVEEFTTWGPVVGGKLAPRGRGAEFQRWVQAFWSLGYQVDWRILNAADYGDATTRRRFFLQARRDGLPIRWPEPTHGPLGALDLFGGRRAWRPAMDVIDWSDLGTSILDRSRPLSLNTRLRIGRGIVEFTHPALTPYYLDLLDLPAESRARLAARPRGRHGPFVVGNRAHNTPRDPGEPLPTATTAYGGGVLLVQPFLLGQHGGSVARAAASPLPTIATDGAIGLVEPHLSLYYGHAQPDPVDEPLSTLTTRPRHGLVAPLVVPYGPRANARSAADPLPTILTKDRLGVAVPFLTPNFGERGDQAPRVHPIDGPTPTVTGRGAGNLVAPVVVEPGEVPGGDPRRLVWINGELHRLDILFRMLRNAELAAAMGFGPEYAFAGSVGEVTRQIGNAVAVHLAEALTRTILASFVGEAAAVAA